MPQIDEMSAKIGVISLGCPKNLVDTEVMIGTLKERGYEFVQDIAQADVVLINTCSFIADAREEAFGAILEAGQQKRYGSVKGIIVTGCLPQRYKERLRLMAPEVDVFLGVAAYKDIEEAVEGALRNKRYSEFPDLDMDQEFDRRVVTTSPPTAYVKIADGCDNRCSYCVIPDVRGPFRSRPVESVVEETRRLVEDGYSEIILVAQDTTRYGADLYGEPRLAQLLTELAAVPGLKWLRILYAYPESVSDELLEVMTSHDNIVKYIDMPVQHLNDDILRAMNRRSDSAQIYETIDRIRAADPRFVIRSTVIAGFPGETPEQLLEMAEGLKRANFNRLGVFAYSQEEGTVAAELPDQVDENEKAARRDTLLNQQATISYQHNQARVGEECEVLVEGFDPRSKLYFGRSYAEAPEVDGTILIKTNRKLQPGTYHKAKIVKALNYDCVAELLPETEGTES
ncbi:MAG: 30S ribosomal protein S12 methylthiotransferase RimO [Clostridia bacterium]|nr:30S ribosomal protein S12 methylthiotransferase RimO [Clostridia bacterium]